MIGNNKIRFPEVIISPKINNQLLYDHECVTKAFYNPPLTHWGRVTHICISKLTTIGSDNGSVPGRRRTIIWTNAGILLIGPLGTNFNEIFIEIY